MLAGYFSRYWVDEFGTHRGPLVGEAATVSERSGRDAITFASSRSTVPDGGSATSEEAKSVQAFQDLNVPGACEVRVAVSGGRRLNGQYHVARHHGLRRCVPVAQCAQR